MDNFEAQEIELPPSDPNDEEEDDDDDDDDDDGDDDEEEEDEEEEEEEEEESEGDGFFVDGADIDGRPGTTSRRGSYENNLDSDMAGTTSLQEEDVNVGGVPSENADGVTVGQTMDIDGGEGAATTSLKEEENGELNRGEIDGLFCPICFEAWSSGGDHHVCCLPCGHIYGLSCIKKWLRRRQGSSKCPQCKTKCGVKDIRLLYASRVVAVDGELQKTVRSLEAKCASLEKKSGDWSKKEVEWKKREADLLKQVQYLEELMQEIVISHKQVEARVAAATQQAEGFTEPQLYVDGIGREKKQRLDGFGCKAAFTTKGVGSSSFVTSSSDLDALRRQLKEEVVQEIRAEMQAAMHKVRDEMQLGVPAEIRAAMQAHMANMDARMASMEAKMQEMVQMLREGMSPSTAPSVQPPTHARPTNAAADPTNENADLGDA